MIRLAWAETLQLICLTLTSGRSTAGRPSRRNRRSRPSGRRAETPTPRSESNTFNLWPMLENIYARKLRLFIKARAFVPVKPFQTSVMLVGKARAYPNATPFRCSTLGYAPGLTRKHLTRLERLARDKGSSYYEKP